MNRGKTRAIGPDAQNVAAFETFWGPGAIIIVRCIV